jgi:stress response protein SCP2
MSKKSLTFAWMLFAGLLTVSCAKAQTTVNTSVAKIYGDWTGESICVDKKNHPACKDEKVVYHFSKSTADAAKIHLAADKIVDGRNELMYELDFIFDAAAGVISAEFTVNGNHGVWEYKISGSEMEGTLKMFPDKTLARTIKVKKTEN